MSLKCRTFCDIRSAFFNLICYSSSPLYLSLLSQIATNVKKELI